jgi:large subunit ribosomal protein L13
LSCFAKKSLVNTMNKTPFIRKEDVENGTYPREWWVVDAEGQTLGRLATKIATLLRGKHKPYYAAHTDLGDFVVVVNAEKVRVSGRKEEQKMYYHHTGFPGGLKSFRLADLRERKPEALVTRAVKGMLAKNALNRGYLRRLKVYAGAEHPHAAQQPKSIVP